MTESLATMFQQHREHLSQLQNRLLTSPIDSIPIDVYKELMITYLCLSKINEAKFLWENLPVNMKTDKEFQYIASLVSSLNLKQYEDFYRLCQIALENSSLYDISTQMNKYIQQLISRVTIQNVELIELAYKSISFDDLQKIFGLNTKMIQQICNERAWQIDSGGIYVLPKRNDNISAASNTNLAKLVELVCFLER
ncbi:unnamed protein product [Rotaria sp. Silwood1]|nr:unnamed protein product [Rotaria sp. Silwood1]CAF1215697.1 unnamed protein product [Rotaria sp. Silwood1]